MQRIFRVAALVGDAEPDTPVYRTVCVAGIVELPRARSLALDAVRKHFVSRGAPEGSVTLTACDLLWPTVDITVSAS